MWRTTRSDVRPLPRAPVVDISEASEWTRSGRRMATSWAIMPLRDAPTTCARPMPSASSRPTVSSAMSSSP
jgi:hypothetical protein